MGLAEQEGGVEAFKEVLDQYKKQDNSFESRAAAARRTRIGQGLYNCMTLKQLLKPPLECYMLLHTHGNLHCHCFLDCPADL